MKNARAGLTGTRSRYCFAQLCREVGLNAGRPSCLSYCRVANVAMNRHLIIPLLAFLFCELTAWAQTKHLPATRPLGIVLTSLVQRKEQVIKRPSKGSQIPIGIVDVKPRTPNVQLNADRSSVQIGEVVRFRLLPASLAANSPFIFTFSFGDGTQTVKERAQAEAVHQYRAAGHYTVSVSVKAPEDGTEIFQPKPEVNEAVTIQVDNVSLSVNPTTVEVGQQVSFETRFLSDDPRVRYRFVFGDNSLPSDWGNKPQATYAYSSAGTYAAHAEIGRMNDGSIDPISNSVTQQIEVSPPPRVDLIVNPTTAELGTAVSFVARSGSSDSSVRYRFIFGDDSPPSDWKDKPEETHAYSSAGAYMAYAEIGRLNDGSVSTIARSPTAQIGAVSPPLQIPRDPPPVVPRGNGWRYLIIIIGLSALFVGYRAWKEHRAHYALRPTIHSHPDPGTSRLDNGKDGLAINFQILLKPDVAGAKYRLNTGEASFIRSKERTKNG